MAGRSCRAAPVPAHRPTVGGAVMVRIPMWSRSPPLPAITTLYHLIRMSIHKYPSSKSVIERHRLERNAMRQAGCRRPPPGSRAPVPPCSSAHWTLTIVAIRHMPYTRTAAERPANGKVCHANHTRRSRFGSLPFHNLNHSGRQFSGYMSKAQWVSCATANSLGNPRRLAAPRVSSPVFPYNRERSQRR